MAHSQREKALDTVRFPYGRKFCGECEYLTAEASVMRRQETAAGDLLQRSYSLPLACSLLLMFFQQVCGINVITFYAVKVFESSASNISAADCTIMLRAARLLALLAASLLIEHEGRRCLILVYPPYVTPSLTVLGLFYYYEDMDSGKFLHHYQFVSLASIMECIASFCLGIGPVPWVVTGEILSTRARGLSSGVSTAFCFFCEFLSTKKIQDLVHREFRARRLMTVRERKVRAGEGEWRGIVPRRTSSAGVRRLPCRSRASSPRFLVRLVAVPVVLRAPTDPIGGGRDRRGHQEAWSPGNAP
ncbi:hypothetical protein HPB50_029254 [Hyalomma asiaticum]|nr:hypothetical protein HPB50_029254 [Hyalomma asiaticum]